MALFHFSQNWASSLALVARHGHKEQCRFCRWCPPLFVGQSHDGCATHAPAMSKLSSFKFQYQWPVGSHLRLYVYYWYMVLWLRVSGSWSLVHGNTPLLDLDTLFFKVITFRTVQCSQMIEQLYSSWKVAFWFSSWDGLASYSSFSLSLSHCSTRVLTRSSRYSGNSGLNMLVTKQFLAQLTMSFMPQVMASHLGC